MRGRVSSFAAKIVLRWWGCTRVAAVIAAAVLAGCQSLPDLGRAPGETSTSGDELTAKGTGPGIDGAKGGDQVVTLDRPAVKRLQLKLAELGFEPGPIDGIVGVRVTGAVKRYQRAHNLPATGAISKVFLEHLEANSANGFANARLPVDLGQEDFPTYRLGTTFVYSNGDIDRVSGTQGAAVEWVRNDGTTYTAFRNFLLPWSNWASDNQRGTAVISEAADALWPLREGAEVEFSADVTLQPKDDPDSTVRRVDHWRCRNDGPRDITVNAGTFETVVFVCVQGANSAAAEIERTWYYAKSIRHYVRFVERNRTQKASRTIDLVAVRPGAPGWPPIVRAALGRAVVHAIETSDDDSQIHWASSGVKTRVTIEAKARFVAANGRPCRRFIQIWSENGDERQYYAMACKSEAGKWQIPGLESNAADLLVTSDDVS